MTSFFFLFLFNDLWQNFFCNKTPSASLNQPLAIFRLENFKREEKPNFLQLNENKLTAEGIIVKEFEGKILYEKNSQKTFSLASLTKLLSAYLALEKFSPQTTFSFDEFTFRNQLTSARFSVGEKANLLELLSAGLIASNNEAIYLIAKTYGLEKFTSELNQLLSLWGFRETKIFEPTGIDEKNISTPEEFADIMFKIYSRHPEVFSLTQKEYLDLNGKRFWTTNLIFRKYNRLIVGAKTGYLPQIGENFALLLKFPNSPFISVVILKSSDRFQDAEIIIKALAQYYNYDL
ncbi:D-alanyl-D-alanine carboxypeptidase DacB [bacterium HR35]|nr:D-alanyl-D-alanine carboxypeptidase DacB [bacterium HR35]